MMITEFSYRELDCSACRRKPNSLPFSGGFMPGPRAHACPAEVEDFGDKGMRDYMIHAFAFANAVT